MRSRRCCHYQISYSAWVLKESGHGQFWEPSQRWVGVPVAVLALCGRQPGFLGPALSLSASLVTSLGLERWNMDSNGRWWKVTGIACSAGEAEGEAFSSHSSGLHFLQMLRCKCNMSLWAVEYFVMRPLMNLITTTFTSWRNRFTHHFWIWV